MNLLELKNFLASLPEEFNDFNLVNGEYGELDGNYHYRIDKPILHIEVDENTKEFCLLHQTEEDIDKIVNK